MRGLWFTAGFLLGVVTTALGLLWMMAMAVVTVTDNNLAAPEWCRGCPDPIYDDRRGEWDWYCRQHSPTGIRCSNVAVLRERGYRVRDYFARKEAST